MNCLNLQRTMVKSMLLVLLASPWLANAQQDGTNGPPKILVIEREFLKPGKSGSAHEKTESAFVRAMTAAKATDHYFALDSVTGASRSLFFFGYPSFEAWEKSTTEQRKNATLSAAIDRAYIADGDLLSQYEQSAWMLRPDLSLDSGDLTGMRFFEITQFIVKPGHEHEIEDLAKMYVEGYKKSVPDATWTTFQMVYGAQTGSAYLVITPMKSLAAADKEMVQSETFMKHMGENGMKKLAELTSSSVETQMVNLFEINPRISYPPDEWIKAEPSFWKPKPTPKPAAKPESTTGQ